MTVESTVFNSSNTNTTWSININKAPEALLGEEGCIEPIYIGGRVVLHSDGQTLFMKSAANKIIQWSPFSAETISTINLSLTDVEEQAHLDDTDVVVTGFTATHDGGLVTYNTKGLFEFYSPAMVPSPTLSNTASSFGTVRSWRAHASPVMVMQGHHALPLLATGSADHAIRVWDWQQGACTHHFKGVHGGAITCLAWHPQEAWLVSGAEDGSIAVWDLLTSRAMKVMRPGEGHSSAITSLQFQPPHLGAKKKSPSSLLLSAGRDQVLCIWNIALDQYGPNKRALVKSLAILEVIEGAGFYSDHSIVWTAGEKGVVRLWNWSSARCIWTSELLCKTGQSIAHAIMLSSVPEQPGNSLIAITTEMLIFRIDLAGEIKESTLLSNGSTPLTLFTKKQIFAGHHGEVTDVTYLGNERLAVATNSSNIRIHHLNQKKSSWVNIEELLVGHEEAVLCLASNNRYLVSGARDHCAIVWAQSEAEEIGEFQAIAKLIGHTDVVSAISVGPSRPDKSGLENLIATASADTTIKLWQLLPDKRNPKNTNSPHNTILKPVLKWTVKAHDKDINSILFTPNGKHLFTGSQDKTIKVWRVEDGKCVATIQGHRRGVWSMALSPREQLLATSSADCTIKLWSLPTNSSLSLSEKSNDHQCLRTLEGHANSVLRVCFIKDGDQLVSAASDGIIKVWDVRSGECLHTVDGHLDRIWALQSDGNRQLVSGDASGTIRFWRDRSEEVELARLAKRDELVLKEQQFSNLILQRDFYNAAILALEMEQPMRLFSLVNNLVDGRTLTEGVDLIIKLFQSCSEQQVYLILKWIRDWNTNLKRAYTNQILLNAIIRALPTNSPILKVAEDVLEQIRLYNERHYEKLDLLLQNSYLIDFVLEKTK